MDAIRKYFNDYIKNNPDLLLKYEKGLLTLDDAIQEYTKQIDTSIKNKREQTAIYNYLLEKGFTNERANDLSFCFVRKGLTFDEIKVFYD